MDLVDDMRAYCKHWTGLWTGLWTKYFHYVFFFIEIFVEKSWAVTR